MYWTQRNMRIHVLAGALAGEACIVLGVGRLEVLMVVLAVAGVLLAEVVNTVAEALTDLLEPRLNPIAKVIKDLAAAGVLLGAGFSVLIAVLVFYPALWDLPERLRDFAGTRLALFAAYFVAVIVPALAGFALPVKKAARGGRRGP